MNFENLKKEKKKKKNPYTHLLKEQWFVVSCMDHIWWGWVDHGGVMVVMWQRFGVLE